MGEQIRAMAYHMRDEYELSSSSLYSNNDAGKELDRVLWEGDNVIKEVMPKVPPRGIGRGKGRILEPHEIQTIDTDVLVVFHNQLDAEKVMDLYYKLIDSKANDEHGDPIDGKPALILEGYEPNRGSNTGETSHQIERTKWAKALETVNNANIKMLDKIQDIRNIYEWIEID